MKSLRINLMALVGLFVVTMGMAVTTQAAAQTVSLRPVVDQLGPLLSVVVAALVTFLTVQASAWIGRKFHLDGLKIDETVRNYLNDAANKGIQYALSQVEKSKFTEIEVKNTVVRIATNYLLERVPDALKRFGLDGAALTKFLEARVGPFDVSRIAKPVSDQVPIGGAQNSMTPLAKTVATKVMKS